MERLLLHPQTKMELSALFNDPPHALLLTAPSGTGKLTVAREWANKLAKNTVASILGPDEKGTIGIDATRALYQHTRSKQPGHQVVIIDHAEAMSSEAQNAFLKLLEEPRQHLTFILTATQPEDLLPTIVSRLQVVALRPIATKTLAAYAQSVRPVDDLTLTQLLFVAQGRPATITRLLTDDTEFDEAKQIMQRAKQLLSLGQYERLAMVQELSKDRVRLVLTLEAMAHMLTIQLARGTATEQWLELADALQECLRRLRQNGNIRAQLTHLFTAY